jgi:ATP-binding cassette subfamily B protein
MTAVAPGPRAGDTAQLAADALAALEPAHEEHVAFSQRSQPGANRPLSLRGLVLVHWRLAAAALALVVTIALADQAGPRLVMLAVDHGILQKRGMEFLSAVAGCYVAAVLLTALCQRWLIQVSGRLSATVMHDVRLRVFTHLQRLSLDYYTREKAGVVMARMTGDVENLQQVLQDGVAQMAVQALTMLVITVVMVTLEPLLALLTVALTVLPLLGSSLWFRQRSAQAYLRVRDASALVMSDLSESLRGHRVVAAHNRQERNAVQHRTLVTTLREANLTSARASSLYTATTQLLGLLSQVLLLAVGGRMVQQGSLSVGALIAFLLYFNRFFQPIQVLVQQFATYQQSRSSIVRLNELLAEQPAVREAPDARPLPAVRGRIRFEQVGFAYVDGRPALLDVDLDIAPGEKVAVVGSTGAGKSTLAKLVVRFHDVTSGRVLIDDVDVRDVTLASLRRQVGLVPQESFLFAGTLRDNVAFGRPDASDDEVRRALGAVGLDDLLAREGLDGVVRERGQSLSAGERQLVALARALVARPSVLVLDEATANLDLQSEARVDRALEVVLQGRTAILIAHRLSTAMRSDRVVVVEDGQIVESGPPADLVAADGRFASMVATWMRLPVRAA